MRHRSPDSVRSRLADSPERGEAPGLRSVLRPRFDDTKERNGPDVAPDVNPIGPESASSSVEWACDDRLIGLLCEMVASALDWETRDGLRSMGSETLATECEYLDGDV